MPKCAPYQRRALSTPTHRLNVTYLNVAFILTFSCQQWLLQKAKLCKMALHIFLVCPPETSFLISQYPFCTTYSQWYGWFSGIFGMLKLLTLNSVFFVNFIKIFMQLRFYLLCLLVVVFHFLIDHDVYYYYYCYVVKFSWLLRLCVFYRFHFCVWECSLIAKMEDL